MVVRLNVLLCCSLAASWTWEGVGILLRREAGVNDPLPEFTINQTLLERAEANLVVANTAKSESEANAKDTLTTQQELVANMAQEAAEDEYDKASKAVPQANAAAKEVAVYTLEAFRHAKHAQKVAAEARDIAANAANAAAEAIRVQIQQEAYAKAEAANKTAVEDFAANKKKKIANAVAAAAEPYHIALLRAQKATQETYTKAKGCLDSAQKLAAKADEMATVASTLQANGVLVQARQMMTIAHGTMASAIKLKTWSAKLYNQANELNKSLGYYQMAMSQAAANAAAVTLVNPAPVMPATPPA